MGIGTASFVTSQVLCCIRPGQSGQKHRRRDWKPPGRTQGNILTDATSAANGYRMPCIMLMWQNAWNVRRGKDFLVTAPIAAKRSPPWGYFVLVAANDFNTEERDYEMTRQQIEKIRTESMKQYGFGPEAMKQIKVCANCGATAPAAKRTCGECGSQLPRETLYQFYLNLHRRCPVCETVLPDNVNFCPQCGTMLTAKCK